MDFERLRTLLGIDQPLSKREDGLWVDDLDLDIELMAHQMADAGARLVTITALPGTEGEIRLIYHWDIEGTLLNLGSLTRNGRMPSIASTCPGADWIEREVRDYFAVTFTGREETTPIVLRAGDPPGLFNWNGHYPERER
jgi:NADH-quinone oxidoreductase subunit C